MRRGRALPDDPVAFARAFLAGAFAVGDIAPDGPDHVGWLTQLVAFLGTPAPEGQEWLRRERERAPGSYPDALLLPATDDEILSALDEVMRRG